MILYIAGVIEGAILAPSLRFGIMTLPRSGHTINVCKIFPVSRRYFYDI